MIKSTIIQLGKEKECLDFKDIQRHIRYLRVFKFFYDREFINNFNLIRIVLRVKIINN